MSDIDLLKNLQQESPCDHCQHAKRCAEERLACSGFSYWVYNGKFPKTYGKNPNRMIYKRMYGA